MNKIVKTICGVIFCLFWFYAGAVFYTSPEFDSMVNGGSSGDLFLLLFFFFPWVLVFYLGYSWFFGIPFLLEDAVNDTRTLNNCEVKRDE